MSHEERAFIHYHQNLVEDNNMNTILKALGVLWDKKDFINNKESEKKEEESRYIFVPLAMSLNPSIHKYVSDSAKKSSGIASKYYGNGDLIEETSNIKSLGDLSKEEFYRKIGQPIPSKVASNEQR